MSNLTLYYLALVSLSLIVLAGLSLWLFRRLQRLRRGNVEDLQDTEVVPTSSPIDQPLHSFKARARRSIKNRFSIFRRVIAISALMLLVLLISFPYIDQLPQAFLSILVGSAAIITGMAARPFIENFLSGMAITASRMLNIGDTVLLNEQYGTIEDISSTHTVIKLWDWRRYVIPNSLMINHEFINYSLYDKWLWANVEFYVSYESDLELVQELAVRAAKSSDHYQAFEEPAFWIMDTHKDSVRCWIAAWAVTPLAAWELKADIRTKLVMELNKRGIRTHINYHEFERTEDPS